MGTLKETRPDLYVKWLDEALEARKSTADHVLEDPVGWLISEASALKCYLIHDPDGSVRINGLLEAQHIMTAIQILQMGAVTVAAFSRPSPEKD